MSTEPLHVHACIGPGCGSPVHAGKKWGGRGWVDAAEPLHVSVARALGWDNLHERTGGHWWGREPHGGLTISVPRYDTSWCSCGPIIQRMNICLSSPNEIADHESGVWDAYLYTGQVQSGKTPCEAVARLIVHLHEQGKLPK